MMNFDEIVVKESPGLCRCCLSEGCYKDMGTDYTWMSEREVYADMLLECFDISISQHSDGPNGQNRLICEVCITRLRDACNFKKQVLDSEKRFVDMLAKGKFRPKVLIYQAAQPSMKAEALLEQNIEGVEAEVEYLEDIDFDDTDDLPLKLPTEPSASEPQVKKGKRGRPKKSTTEKKKKVDDKPKTKVSKGQRIREVYADRLSTIRRNITYILRYSNAMPFHWQTKGFKCFYCNKHMRDCETLKEHTLTKHQNVDLPSFVRQRIITKDVPVKMDVTNLCCNVCPQELTSIDDLTAHIIAIHGEDYDPSTGICIFPFILTRDIMECVLCPTKYDNFMSMVMHMYKEHMQHSYICQICGLSFINKLRLNRHVTLSHVGHKCTICKKIFDAFHKLEKHKERIHGHVRSFECSLCSAKFDNNYQVKVHMGKVHNVEKYRIKCEFCPKITTTKGAMVLHMQSIHSDLRYSCDLCDYKTGIKWMIKLHQRKHFGEKNYTCSVCDRKFGRSSNVRAHMKVHTGNVGRVCRWCRYGFTDLESLNKHEMEMHYYNQYT